MAVAREQTLRLVCGSLEGEVNDVVGRWTRTAAHPASGFPPAQCDPACLPECLDRLIQAALCRPDDHAGLMAVAASAAEHGRQRAAAGARHDLLGAEFSLLREVLRDHLAERGHAPDDITLLLVRIDAALGVAVHAAMLGYHRDELQQAGRWDALLERVVRGQEL